jgi:hypothetical protein
MQNFGNYVPVMNFCLLMSWFISFQAATKEVEKDFESVYSRLVLCKTYR